MIIGFCDCSNPSLLRFPSKSTVPHDFHYDCYAAHKRPHDQNLFGIVQGGLDPVLRLEIQSLHFLLSFLFFSFCSQFARCLYAFYLVQYVAYRDICVKGLVERNLPGYVRCLPHCNYYVKTVSCIKKNSNFSLL